MATAGAAAALNVGGRVLKHHNILLVIKQTAFEEYSQVRRQKTLCFLGQSNLGFFFSPQTFLVLQFPFLVLFGGIAPSFPPSSCRAVKTNATPPAPSSCNLFLRTYR